MLYKYSIIQKRHLICVICVEGSFAKTSRHFPIKLKLALDTINFSDKGVFEKGSVAVR